MRWDRRQNKRGGRRLPASVEPLEPRLLMAVFTVTNTNDSGAGSLRAAVDQANSTGGVDTISFNIALANKTIHCSNSLDLWDATIVDATTQPGYAGKPLIQIDGAGTSNGTDGFRLGGGCTLKGFSITRFAGEGIGCATSTGAGGNTLQANWIGVDPNGNAAGNGGNAVAIYTPNNIVGGPAKADGNLISANGGFAVFILGGLFGNNAPSNLVQNNLIGTSVSGAALMGNYNGVGIQSSPNNQILTNVISGSREVSANNGGDGVILTGSATGTLVRGNYIGTDVTGTTAITNQQYGIEIQSSGNTIQGNIVSGNTKAGIVFYTAGANGNLVKANFIGTDVTGTRALGNGNEGIAFASAGPNQIGGSNADGNAIAANHGSALGIFPGNGEVVTGNIFGAGVDGRPLPNLGGDSYVSSDSQNNVISNNRGPFTAPAAPVLQSAVSRRQQGVASFDIPLPLVGTPAVECRTLSAGVTLVLTFDKSIAAAGAAVTSGAAILGGVTFSGNTISINLTNVTNAQRLTITLSHITASDGGTAATAAVTLSVLEGDVNGNGTVSGADVNLIKAAVSSPVTSANFRTDLNGNGVISGSDVNLAKFRVGAFLPMYVSPLVTPTSSATPAATTLSLASETATGASSADPSALVSELTMPPHRRARPLWS